MKLFTLAILFFHLSSHANEVCRSSIDTHLLKDSCEAVVDELYVCNNNSFDPIAWYGPKVGQKIKEVNDLSQMNLSAIEKLSADPNIASCAKSIFINSARRKRGKINRLKKKLEENLSPLQVLRLISDDRDLWKYSPLQYSAQDGKIKLQIFDVPESVFSNTNSHIRCKELYELPLHSRESNYPFEVLERSFPKGFFKTLNISMNTRLDVSKINIVKLCHFSNTYPDPIKVMANIASESLNGFNAGYFKIKKGSTKDLIDQSKKNLAIRMEVTSAFYKCASDLLDREEEKLLSDLLNSPYFQKSKSLAEDTLDHYIAKFQTLSEGNWGVELEINNSSNNIYSNILSQLMMPPFSKESLGKLKEELGKFKNFHIIQNREFAKSKIKNLRWLGGVNEVKNEQSRIGLSHAMILYGAHTPNRTALNFVMAHEVAHVLTTMLDKRREGASEKSLTDVTQRINSCLYGEDKKGILFGEDLADLLASKMLDTEPEKLNYEQVNKTIKFFCHLSNNRILNSQAGHSFGFQRALNFVLHNKSAQNILGCRPKQNVCSLNFYSQKKSK